jgi:hypothetical protein
MTLICIVVNIVRVSIEMHIYDEKWAEARRKHLDRKRALVFSIGFIFWLGLLGGIANKVGDGVSYLMFILSSV